MLNLEELQQDIRTAARPGGFFYGRQALQNSTGDPAMPSTTDDLRIKDIEALRPPDEVMRSRDPISPPHNLPASTRVSAKPAANVYPFVKAADNDGCIHREAAAPVVRIWWERWLERRRFARALPWMADEVLKDYGLTRQEARRLCRRPFWRA